LRTPVKAKYGDYEAVIAIGTGEIIEGRLPPRVLGLVQAWREYHRGRVESLLVIFPEACCDIMTFISCLDSSLRGG
jgi:hypothetical protein